MASSVPVTMAGSMAGGLSIKEVAEQTGLAPGTIRMWEQRYGFPTPGRTASGYRRYEPEDIETLRRARGHRQRGLSVRAALERARETRTTSDHPSIFAAVAATDQGARAQVLRKSTLIALSRAIEHELLARAAAPVLFGAFQRERFYRALEPRYRRLAHNADAATVFADFATLRRPSGAPVEVPIAEGAALANEWALIVDAPGYAACLLAWEQPGAIHTEDLDRRFEAIWTIDPRATRRAAQAAAGLAGNVDAQYGRRLAELLADRPLALEQPAPALTALTNRLLAYVEAAGGS